MQVSTGEEPEQKKKSPSLNFQNDARYRHFRAHPRHPVVIDGFLSPHATHGVPSFIECEDI